MFDELDEGTAIFKTRSYPPQCENLFVAENDVPVDHCLWLTGMAGELLRGKLKAERDALPVRKKQASEFLIRAGCIAGRGGVTMITQTAGPSSSLTAVRLQPVPDK